MKTMLKLRLNLDQLTVESFEIANERQARGTVRAYVCSDMCTASCDPTCGILPASAESECAAFAQTQFCGDTNDFACCV